MKKRILFLGILALVPPCKGEQLPIPTAEQLLAPPPAGMGELWSEQEMFAKWMQFQEVFKPVSLTRKVDEIADPSSLYTYFRRHEPELGGVRPFMLDRLFLMKKAHGSFVLQPRRSLLQVYGWLDSDPGRFLDFLIEDGFRSQPQNSHEQKSPIQATIRQYNKLMNLLFLHPERRNTFEALFTLAGKLFNYCYGTGYARFKTLLEDKSKHQLARLCTAIIWQQLVGEGWKHWNQACLDNLVREAQQGKKIVYIAGGNDLQQLVKALMHAEVKGFTIDMIDPMFLETQSDYYAENPQWWLSGKGEDHGLGDRVMIEVDGRLCTLKRTDYTEEGTFEATDAHGKTSTLPMSITTWTILNPDRVECGQVRFKRKFCQLEDLMQDPAKTVLLASFNEMYFMVLEARHSGWGIDISKLPKSFICYCKQLADSVALSTLNNVRKAECIKFPFIYLGSNPT